MIIWLWARWWYSAGWMWAWQRAVVDRIAWCNNAFSLNRLVATWFAPFKQTAVGKVKGSLGVHFRAFIDSLVSRTIGFLVRSILIGAGLIAIVLAFVSGLLFLALWPFLPFLPIVALLMSLDGGGA